MNLFNIRYRADLKKFVQCALLGALSVYASTSQAYYFNTDITNTTPNVANDYHIKLHANQNLSVDHHWEMGGNVVFPTFVPLGVGTQDVTLNWSGATVNQGDMVHVGASGSLGVSVQVTESWWTFGGLPITTQPSNTQASVNFDGIGSTFWIAWIDLFDSAHNAIGTEWVEEISSAAPTIFNAGNDQISVSYGFMTSNTLIPIEDLNENLGRSNFGQFSSIMDLHGVPEPASLLLVTTGLIVFVVNRRRKNDYESIHIKRLLC